MDDTVWNEEGDKYLSVEDGAIYVSAKTSSQACAQVESFGKGIAVCERVGLFFFTDID